MPISSQAPNGEGSETISKESRVQADPKRPAPLNWGDDIVQSSWKREAALKRLVKGIRITKTGCWEWKGSKTVGYGTLKMPEIYGNFKILAHRLSWVAFKGEPIADGLFVCHRCDNRKYTDEQLLQVAGMILDGRLSNTEIAGIVGTTRYLVQDMRRGRLHSRFMERAANSDCG